MQHPTKEVVIDGQKYQVTQCPTGAAFGYAQQDYIKHLNKLYTPTCGNKSAWRKSSAWK